MAGSVRFWYILLAIQVAAYLPIWRWYLARMTDGSDEPWGLIALAAAVIMFLVDKERLEPQPNGDCRHRRHARPWVSQVPSFYAGDSDLLLPSLLIVAYAVAYSFVPRLVQAMIAMTALSCTASVIALGMRVHVPTMGLLLLSLPLVPSLQFYLGYPFRVLCGSLTAPLLQLAGLAVVREGTSLRFGSQLVSIDAPCSGVKMLWAGLFLAFLLSSLFRLSPLRTVLTACAAVCAVLFGNVWRSAALFCLESGMLMMPEWCHDAVGLCIFTGIAFLILWFTDRMGNRGLPRIVAPDSGKEPCRHSPTWFTFRRGNVS